MPPTATTKRPAAVPAHLSSKSDNWPTPQGFYDILDAEFGFVLDACASTTNHKARVYYALDHTDPDRRDGLAGDWAADAAAAGGPVWMNPPYGRPIGDWMAKAHATAQAGAVVVALVPVRADTAWWHTHVLAAGAEVRYVRGRLTFGDAANTAPFASAVVIYRPGDVPGAPGPVGTMPARPAPTAPAATVAPTATAGPRSSADARSATIEADHTPAFLRRRPAFRPSARRGARPAGHPADAQGRIASRPAARSSRAGRRPAAAGKISADRLAAADAVSDTGSIEHLFDTGGVESAVRTAAFPGARDA